ncbi:MAG: two-component sensor histidine kinase [Silicimonas sp.]|nr:two-component sensor histidine kinase [Silicimonas sp.]
MAFSEWRARVAELSVESARLHAIASQRVDQHDAHLTALSAIAVAGAEQRPDLFREVAGAIMRFYPRITGISLIPLDNDGGALEIGTGQADLRGLIREAAHRSTGAPVLVRYPDTPPAYVIVKRSPNTDAARYGLALVIDAATLLDDDSGYWSKRGTARRLSLPDGAPILIGGTGDVAPQVSQPLSSGTQPLRLETAIEVDLADLFPLGRVALVVAVITLAMAAARIALRQRAQVRAAEKRAELSGLESRLSHASRVNALGEMASGMAHELTQPLTAILAQTQAAKHLAARGQTDKVAAVLDDVVGQTRRASEILERLRTWTRPNERHPEAVDLRDCIRAAETLLGTQAAGIGATLKVALPDASVAVLADRVELEQVIFNLVRNALDAVGEGAGARAVSVTLAKTGDAAHIDVADTGPGIREDIRDKLFTPFVTTRDSGTGLGLALSQRLVERAGGELSLVPSTAGARFRVSLPLAQSQSRAAE